MDDPMARDFHTQQELKNEPQEQSIRDTNTNSKET